MLSLRGFLVASALVAVLAMALPASAQVDPSITDWTCKAPQHGGLLGFVETVAAATCEEAHRNYVLAVAFFCDVTGLC